MQVFIHIPLGEDGDTILDGNTVSARAHTDHPHLTLEYLGDHHASYGETILTVGSFIAEWEGTTAPEDALRPLAEQYPGLALAIGTVE